MVVIDRKKREGTFCSLVLMNSNSNENEVYLEVK